MTDYEKTDYEKYRGQCKKMSEALVASNPSLRLVRGYYECPYWGTQAHWWCEKEDGTIVDPTKDQFPSKGMGFYEEFDGMVECANCGTSMREEDVHGYGNYGFCSGPCLCAFVGVA